MASTEFELIQTKTAPHRIVELRGEVDAINAKQFERELGTLTDAGAIILDLSAIGYFDSAGFEVLDRALANGKVVVVISPTGILRRAAMLMSVPFHDTVDQAAEALAASR